MLRKTPLKSKTPLKAKTGFKKSPWNRNTTKKKSGEPNYVDDMDTVFQFYVRLRDAMPGGMTRCISCGKIKPFDKMQGGHFHSRRYMSTRWNEDNVNSECSGCNGYDGDHLLGYRENLIRKIGMTRYKLLEATYLQDKKWNHFEIVLLVKHYGRLCLQLSASKHIPLSKRVQDIIKRYMRIKL